MIQRQITNNTMERFIKQFKEKCDYLKQNGHVRYLPEIEVSMIVDAINLWEQEKVKLLTLRDQALLYSEARIFPNSGLDNSMGVYRTREQVRRNGWKRYDDEL